MVGCAQGQKPLELALCSQFERAGSCLDGSCRFAHGTDELQKRERAFRCARGPGRLGTPNLALWGWVGVLLCRRLQVGARDPWAHEDAFFGSLGAFNKLAVLQGFWAAWLGS